MDSNESMDIDMIQETKMTPIEGKNVKLYCFEELDSLCGKLTDWRSKKKENAFLFTNRFSHL
jgi:hypothetical protein